MKRDRLPELLAEIRDELASLDRLIQSLQSVIGDIPGSEPARSVYLESAALKLHNFYTACERLFERIASTINGGVPREPDWHRRLLNSMSLEVERVRPAVIERSTCRDLGEFLAFRHLVRNIYGYELDGARVMALAAKAVPVFAALKADIKRFCFFLEDLLQ